MTTTTDDPIARAVESIAAIVTRERDTGALDVHDRAVVERSLAVLRDGAPRLELVVGQFLAAGPTARLVVREREWGGHEALIVMRDEGAERTASRQYVEPDTAEALRPLAAERAAQDGPAQRYASYADARTAVLNSGVVDWDWGPDHGPADVLERLARYLWDEGRPLDNAALVDFIRDELGDDPALYNFG